MRDSESVLVDWAVAMLHGSPVEAPFGDPEGAKVIAGTVNGSGSLRIQVTGIGEGTALANIMLELGFAAIFGLSSACSSLAGTDCPNHSICW